MYILIIELKYSTIPLQTFLLCSLGSKKHLLDQSFMQSHLLTKLIFELKCRKDRKQKDEIWAFSPFSPNSQATPGSHYQLHYFYNHLLWTNLPIILIPINHSIYPITHPETSTYELILLAALEHTLTLKLKIMLIYPFDSPHPTMRVAFISANAKN